MTGLLMAGSGIKNISTESGAGLAHFDRGDAEGFKNWKSYVIDARSDKLSFWDGIEPKIVEGYRIEKMYAGPSDLVSLG